MPLLLTKWSAPRSFMGCMIGALIDSSSCALAEPTNPTPVSSAAIREYLTSLYIPIILQIDLAKTRGSRPALSEPDSLSFFSLRLLRFGSIKRQNVPRSRGTLTVYEPDVNDNCCVSL